jgi:hypothetical protein
VKISWTLTSTGTSVSAPASAMTNAAIAAGSIGSTLSGGASPTGTITFTVFGPAVLAAERLQHRRHRGRHRECVGQRDV